jgi:hypothetical protein
VATAASMAAAVCVRARGGRGIEVERMRELREVDAFGARHAFIGTDDANAST